MPRPWQITKVELTSDAKRFGIGKAWYVFHVEGFNHNCRPAAPISWAVPDLHSPDFDLDLAEFTDEARAAFTKLQRKLQRKA